MSCVALCIKLISWMFGHRGRRRRFLPLPHGQGADEQHEEELCRYQPKPRTVIVLDTNPSGERDGRALHKSEIELREVPFGNIEEQLGVCKDGGGAARAAAGSTKDGEDERFNGSGVSRMKRETTNGSTMTRTGTPSVIGQQDSCYCSDSGSSHGADVRDEGGEQEEEEEGGEEEGGEGGQGENYAEQRRWR